MSEAPKFFSRDLSWLSFNGTVLAEAAKPEVPLLERILFLAIFSSNLDEFYRVRVPVAIALSTIKEDLSTDETLVKEIQQTVNRQQEFFGKVLVSEIIPALKEQHICLVYNEPLPEALYRQTTAYFYSTLAAYLQVTYLGTEALFLENNHLYFAVTLQEGTAAKLAIVAIPSHLVPRFFTAAANNRQYVVFIDDIIRKHLPVIFKGYQVQGAYSIKVTRDADLNLQDEYVEDLAGKIETQISKRDAGLATRLLYAPDLPADALRRLIIACRMEGSVITAGGRYHNLKDFFSFPVNRPDLKYLPQLPVNLYMGAEGIFEFMEQQDRLVHTPYMSYDAVLRFFNEAAIDQDTEEIYTTLYRVASDSKIAHALMTAAKNGKKVTAFIELKARFDEANNIKWAKVMKGAGVNIIYSIPGLKVHAKVTLVKRRQNGRLRYYGLLATGNFNENTARVYADHILLTTSHSLLRELELLFIFLAKRRKPRVEETGLFQQLLVAQFNLLDRFMQMIENEIANKRKGLPAGIRIKLNNIQEETLINKLYDASNAGVPVELIVRSICRVVPGVKGMSENITVKRIVDRYLEHGRVFIFHNNGDPLVFMGSADWMNRNIYSRIEVCLPINDAQLKSELISIVNLQWEDNAAAVEINSRLETIAPSVQKPVIRSQQEIYSYIKCVLNDGG
ncbi:polyphosphate kinase 1 [Niabella ginsenosidivorans]|uniref:Polyphosphate kinase n=1 Tax=Niabella ginsenosidivorans TaxID=1176587 RepID=A0A1A9I715_9BACT|nr:polyphosphate kinase 1 [Niabella ginsenosidivorans]ANH83468.1 polyphosphate kinase 1 [Niabella ginsenosidivorans]